MATPKYKTQLDTMLLENKKLFEDYLKLEESYIRNPSKHKDALSEMRRELLKLMRKHENRLCARTENTKYSKYSENLAMKFWEEIRILFPNVERIVE